MATSNVTPIRPPKKERPKRAAKQKGLLLRDSDESDRFTTLDLVNGLQAVCYALDQNAGYAPDIDFIHRLSMAANVLATMVADRVE
jgi:hypothetical protein